MITVIEDSPFIAVSIVEMKEHLRIEHDQLDGIIVNYIKLATRFVERMLGKSFLNKTYRYFWRQSIDTCWHQSVKMPFSPVIDVIHIKNLENQSKIRRFTIDMNQFISIDSIYSRVEFIFVAGMTDDPKHIPSEYKNLICMVAQAMFEEKDIETHPCMKVLKCYKENSCTLA